MKMSQNTRRWLGLSLMLAGFAMTQAPAQAQVRNRGAIWMWTDKYVYQPGEQATVRWSAIANDDHSNYTVFIYLQNNQTGAKTYYPNGTAAVTDYAGRTADQGYFVVNPVSISKLALFGPGGFYPAINVPSALGMHSVVIEFRDATATRVLKKTVAKFSVVDEIMQISGNITSDTTFVNTKAYRLNGIVFVKDNAVLTIQPGTIITGAPGTQPSSALIVSQTGRIEAAGTKSRPIIMTSDRPFGQRARGDWGGLVLLGKAPINVGANANNSGNAAGTFFIEGLQATPESVYGGTDPAHDCGTLTYVRVEYAGSILSPNNELNSFTWGGCGTRTTAHHLQAIYGLDDAFEWFGGTMNAKYLVGGLNADDFLDFQLGFTGKVQYGVFYQSSAARGNRGMEGDNSEFDNGAAPVSNPTFSNLTFIGSRQAGFDESNAPGVFLRRGARATINNTLIMNFFSSGLEFTDANTQTQMNNGQIKMNGFLMFNNNNGGAPTVEGQIVNSVTRGYANGTNGGGTSANFVISDPGLARPGDLSDPDFRPQTGAAALRTQWVAPPDDGFFDQSANFVGGMGDENWMEEWTSFLQETDF